VVLDEHSAMVALHDLLDDGQPETGPRFGSRGRRPVEAVDDVRHVLRGDADAVVASGFASAISWRACAPSFTATTS
jgi:hypothetical protein